MVKLAYPRPRSVVVGGVLLWVAVTQPGVRRHMLSTVGAATFAVYQTAVNRLQSEVSAFDNESQVQEARLAKLCRALDLATSDAERLAIDNESRTGLPPRAMGARSSGWP